MTWTSLFIDVAGNPPSLREDAGSSPSPATLRKTCLANSNHRHPLRHRRPRKGS